MFCDHSFCEAPFASFISIEINGEIFYYDLSIKQSITFDAEINRFVFFDLQIDNGVFELSIRRSINFELNITQNNNEILVR